MPRYFFIQTLLIIQIIDKLTKSCLFGSLFWYYIKKMKISELAKKYKIDASEVMRIVGYLGIEAKDSDFELDKETIDKLVKEIKKNVTLLKAEKEKSEAGSGQKKFELPKLEAERINNKTEDKAVLGVNETPRKKKVKGENTGEINVLKLVGRRIKLIIKELSFSGHIKKFFLFTIIGVFVFAVSSKIFFLVKNRYGTDTVTISDARSEAEYVKLIRQADEQKSYESAVVLIESFKHKFPQSDFLEEVYFKTGEILFKWEKHPAGKQFQESKAAFEKAIARYPGSKKVSQALFMVGECLRKTGLYEEALAPYREIFKRYPEYGNLDKVQFSIAECYFAAEKYDYAIKEYEGVITKFPNSSMKEEAFFQIGVCLADLGLYEKAISVYGEILENFPNSERKDDVRFSMAGIYLLQGRYNDAMEGYRAMMGKYPYDYHNAKAQFMIAECLAKQNKFNEARKALVNVIYNYMNNTWAQEAVYKIGDYYFEEKNIKRAVDFYNIALEKYPNHKLARPTAILLTDIYVNNREYDKASDFLSDLLNSSPNAEGNDKIQMSLGRVYYMRGMYAVAANAFESFVKSYPDSSLVEEAVLLKADSYFSSQLYKEARAVYIYMLKNYPGVPWKDYLYYRIGECGYNLGLYDDALAFLEEGISNKYLKEYGYEARFIMAKCFLARNEDEKAINYFKALVNDDFLKGKHMYYKACFELSKIFYERKENQQAKKSIDIIINNAADNPLFLEAVAMKAGVLADEGRSREAVNVYKRAIKSLESREVSSEKARIKKIDGITRGYTYIGDILFEQKEFKQALAYYLRANQVSTKGSDGAWILYQIANSYKELGNYEMAYLFYENTRKDFPDNSWSSQIGWNMSIMKGKDDSR